MLTHYAPQQGDIGLTVIGGPLGFFVTLGQWLNGDLSSFDHAFIVLDDGTAIEARPGGARILPLTAYSNRPVRYSRYFVLNGEQRAKIVKEARALKGTPYSFLDYLAMALVRLHLPSKRLRAYVASSHHMICSQLVDYAYCRAGVHLFTDGRLSQDVSPGDIDRVLSLEY